MPADLSVIGFDDMPLASYFDPPLTTMRQDTFAIGRICVARLIDALGGAELPAEPIRSTSELVVRASTAPPRASAPEWR